MSKAYPLDPQGKLRTDRSAFTSIETTLVIDPNPAAPPANPLANRRFVVLAFPTDTVRLGDSAVSDTTGYGTRGTARGSGWDHASARALYSSRFQFLRGQYASIQVSDGVEVYARIHGVAFEDVVVLELA